MQFWWFLKPVSLYFALFFRACWRLLVWVRYCSMFVSKLSAETKWTWERAYATWVLSSSVGFCNFWPVTNWKKRHGIFLECLSCRELIDSTSWDRMVMLDRLGVFVCLCQKPRFVVVNVGIVLFLLAMQCGTEGPQMATNGQNPRAQSNETKSWSKGWPGFNADRSQTIQNCEKDRSDVIVNHLIFSLSFIYNG